MNKKPMFKAMIAAAIAIVVTSYAVAQVATTPEGRVRSNNKPMRPRARSGPSRRPASSSRQAP
jgi:hypothetical protein